MKKHICSILALLMLIGSLAACSTAQASQMIPQGSASTSTYTAPARFTGDWTGIDNTFAVHADADIQLADTAKLVTADVQRANFTQEQADRLMAFFLKGNPLYENIYGTKQSIQAQIEEKEAILRGEKPYPEDGDGSIERLPEVIDYYKKMLETAPNEWEQPLANTEFHAYQSGNGEYPFGDNWQLIEGYAQVDGNDIQCSIVNHLDGLTRNSAQFWFKDYAETFSPAPKILTEYIASKLDIDPDFSKDSAKAMGDALIQELGLDFSLSQIDATAFVSQREYADNTYTLAPDTPTGYVLYYVRNVNGLPLTKTNFNADGSATVNPAPGSFPYEYIRIIVNQDGVVWFDWECPYTEPQITGTNLELLPFKDIQELFSKLYFLHNSDWSQINAKNGTPTYHNVTIDHVELTLMRVRDAHTLGPATIVPVWDFWGTDDMDYGKQPDGTSESGKNREVLLTINALDGSLLDRELGY